MSTQILSLMATIVSADRGDVLHRLLQTTADALGFERFAFGLELRTPLMAPARRVESGYAPAWQRLYAERDYVAIDPAVAHCLARECPLVWSDAMYGESSLEMREEARHHGLAHGLSIPVRGGEQVLSMLSLARDRPFDACGELQAILPLANLVAHCVHVTATKLLVPTLRARAQQPLTAREFECLNWVAKGKSNSVIADILKVSEPTVAFHMKNVMEKLSVSSRPQAVAIGVALGMVF